MKMSKRMSTIILWVVSLGLLAGMVVTFTPGLSLTGGSVSRGDAQIVVNGQTLYDLDIQQLRNNALFNTVTDGEVGQDLQRLLADEIVRNAVLDQAASRISVSGGQVRSAVNDFRKDRGVDGARNDQAYLQLIGSAGYTDQTFRDYLRDQLRLQEWENRLVKDATVSDAEVDAFFESHRASYQSEEKILARQIVAADQQTAENLRRQALAGADFAALARDNSLELADRDGAVGAAAGETTPRPVGRPALPTVVANAAFSLRGAGLTDVIAFNDRYYVVSVEGYEPAADLPLDEVKDTVSADALDAKKSGIVEAELERLRAEAQVSFPATSTLRFDNPVLAKVGDHEIKAVDLDRALYTNTQIQQALSPATADLIVGLFKPTVLNQLIDTEVAYQGAETLGVPLVGTRSGIAQAALNYIGRDEVATAEDVETYYADNQAMYTFGAEATVTKVEFSDAGAAAAFRTALLDGDTVAAATEAAGGTLTELGRVKPGDLATELDTALFSTDAFDPLPGGALSVSDVLVIQQPAPDASEATGTDEAVSEAGGEDLAGDGVDAAPAQATIDTYVVLVADRVAPRVRPLADVYAQVEQAVLAQKRQAARTAWLSDRRAATDIVETSVPDLVLPTDTLQGTDATAAPDAATDETPTNDEPPATDEAPSGDEAPAGEEAPAPATSN